MPLRRLRQAIYLQVRDSLGSEDLNPQALAARPDLQEALAPGGRLHVSRKAPCFWPAAGLVLDVLQAVGARVSVAAETLGISTANLVDFLQVDAKLWQQARGPPPATRPDRPSRNVRGRSAYWILRPPPATGPDRPSRDVSGDGPRTGCGWPGSARRR